MVILYPDNRIDITYYIPDRMLVDEAIRFHCMHSREFKTYQMSLKMIFSMVKRYRIYSLLSDKIYILLL